MRRLNLGNYDIFVRDQKGDKHIVTYQFQDNLVSIMLHPKSNYSGPEAYACSPLVKKIRSAADEVILYEREYQEIISTFKIFRGFCANDIEFLERIYLCPVIPDKDSKGKVIELSDN